MPIDRNTPNSLKPKLASNRTAKTPLTPRLAATASAPPTSSAQAPRLARSSNGTTPRANSTVYEEVTPVKPFLSSNITPRSSSRKSRVGIDSLTSTPNDTPTSTPTTSRPASTLDFGGSVHGGSNVGAQGALRPRIAPQHHNSHPGIAPRPMSGVYSAGQPVPGPARDGAMFFHASDARPQEQLPAPKKAPTFFYANAKQDEKQQRQDASSPPLSSLGRPQPESKFFHADALSEGRNRSPALTPPPISTSPEPLHPPTAQDTTLRPPSPTKDWHLSYRKGASQVIRPALVTRNSGLSALSGPASPELPDSARRRSSTASTSVRGGHMKSSSLSSIDSVTSPRRNGSNDLSTMTPSPLHHENRIVSNMSLPDITSIPSPQAVTFAALPSPGLTSPIKPAGTQSALETMNELAANARRERKVLDLEISNSSLLAINRSLEKEVRKQKAELRRFRRLSRAGRFSIDTTGSAVDTFSPVGASHIGELSDMSEEEEEGSDPEPPEEDAESSDSSLDEGQLSPSAQEAKDEAHRLRDERRLQLDLSKHRDLLIDSQKMNQSLKRCMNWTEQLIKDGQKALDYQVHVSDVKLGGRVLVTEDDHEDVEEDEEDEPTQSRGLLSPWSPMHTALETIEALDSPFFPGVHKIVDRDSGVDVDGFEAVASGLHDETALLGSPFEERIQRLHASIEALEKS